MPTLIQASIILATFALPCLTAIALLAIAKRIDAFRQFNSRLAQLID